VHDAFAPASAHLHDAPRACAIDAPALAAEVALLLGSEL
jgi:hypothetical protein